MSGVPQGSFLGPLFIINFIIDLLECCTIFHVVIFADDTQITTNCLYELQNDFLRLHDWAFENKNVFNADKTLLVWFSLKKPDVKKQPIIVFD